MVLNIIRLAAFLIVLPLAVLNAQPSIYEDWRWTTFTTTTGLPANSVLAIAQTNDGVLWAYTVNGLCWFDGFRWLGVPASLHADSPDQFTLSEGTDTIGSLLIVARDTLYRNLPTGCKPLYAPVREAAPLSDGRILIRNDSVLLCFDHGKLSPFPEPPHSLTDRSHQRELFRTRNGRIWINRRDGLYVLDGNRWLLFLSSPANTLGINCIQEDSTRRGMLSIGSPAELRGLWMWETGVAPRRVAHEEGDRLQSIEFTPDGGAYSLSSDGMLFEFRGRTWRKIDPLPAELKHVSSIRTLPNGELWVAGEQGLSLFNGHAQYWTYRVQPPPSHNRIHEIVRRRNGELWLGTADGLLIEDNAGATRSITSINGAPIPDITGVAEDATGAMWISSGSAFEGVFRLDGNGKWTHVSIGDAAEGNRFHRIKRDNEGNLWFLGIPASSNREKSNGPGVYRYDYKTFHHLGTKEGLISGYVYAFAAGPDGSLWFGTATGLCCRKNGRWLAWRGGSEIPLMNVFALAMDRDGNLWMADRQHGVVRLDRSGNISHFTQNDGLSDDRVWEIFPDRRGGIWAATTAGVSRFHDGMWSTYGENTGLQTPALWPIAVEGDTVLAGTLGGGLALLDLHECSAPYPKIIIGEPNGDNGNISLQWNAYGWQGYPPPGEIQTRSRLDSNAWSPWGTARQLDLVNLSPGRHRFLVQARNIFGVYAPDGIGVEITVLPPFYKKPLFVVSFLLLCLLAAILRIKYLNDLTTRKSL